MLRDAAPDAIPEAIAKLNFIFIRTHDPFDEGIDRLCFALDVDIGWIREHTRLGELARRWDRDGRRSADLLRGPVLDTAENWLSVQPRQAPAPTEVHRDFIRSSRLGATRRQRTWITGSLIVALVSIGLSVLAYWQRNEAVVQRTHANARRLAAEAQVVLSDPLAPPEMAVQNLLASLRLEKSDEAKHALKVGVSRLQPEPVGMPEWPPRNLAPVVELRFSPNGSWLVGVTAQEVLVWDIKTHALRIRHPIERADLRTHGLGKKLPEATTPRPVALRINNYDLEGTPAQSDDAHPADVGPDAVSGRRCHFGGYRRACQCMGLR